jgi:hypothetical protein
MCGDRLCKSAIDVEADALGEWLLFASLTESGNFAVPSLTNAAKAYQHSKALQAQDRAT